MRNIQQFIYQTYIYIHTYCAVFISTTLAGYVKAKMRVLILFVLFAYSFGRKVHPQNSKQCVMNEDVHELLVKLKCELVNTRRKLQAFEGKIHYNKIILNKGRHFLTVLTQ